MEHGWVVVTDDQYQGRGQAGNQWFSHPKSNLTFSILLGEPFHVKDQFNLNIFASLSITDLMLSKGIPALVKWPNDILSGGKKISGILIENTLSGSQVTQSIIGIGLNVNQSANLPEHAVSLVQLSGRVFDLPELLLDLFKFLDHRYQQWKSAKENEMRHEWLDRLYLKGMNHTFTVGGHPIMGIIQGIDEFGRLRVETEVGIRFFGFKEISF
jgi:BirA family transcriptional regulator, biotin operon repressor / biotin---[acetyl-CoA-carboxylase] ligase